MRHDHPQYTGYTSQKQFRGVVTILIVFLSFSISHAFPIYQLPPEVVGKVAGLFYSGSSASPPMTFTVNQLNDPGDSICDDTCTLRDAISAANDNTGADTITFAVSGTINLVAQLPTISDDLTINGPGADQLTIRRNVAAEFRIFRVLNADATFSDITVSNGLTSEGGGGIYFLSEDRSNSLSLNACRITGNTSTGLFMTASLTGGDSGGGGVAAAGTLHLSNSTISGNVSTHGGGGIAVHGTLQVFSSTISGNSATSSTTGDGGGIFLSGSGIIESSTISGNQASGSSTAIFRSGGGGGIYSVASFLEMQSSTVTGNTATFSGGGIKMSDDLGANSGAFLKSSIIALNTNSDISGKVRSNGYNAVRNIESGGTWVPQPSTDLVPALDQIRLGPLQDNGGPTHTHALQADSVLIDKGDTSFSGLTDQRGYSRIFDDPAITNALGGNGSDIGAVETGGTPPPPPTPTPTPTPTVTPTPVPTPTPPPTLDFGDQAVGTTSAQQFIVLTNTQEFPLELGTPTFVDGTQFGLVEDPAGTVVQPGGQASIGFNFTPTSPGPKADTATLIVIFEGSPVPVATIGLSGNGVGPEIDVEIQVVGSIVDGATVQLGALQPSASLVRIVTIRNFGNGPLDIGNIIISNPHFQVSGPPPTTPLAPGATTTFQLSFSAPATPGLVSTTISFATNDADENPFNFTVEANVGSASAVTTNAATNVAATTATLNGSANPNGLATTAWFRYGMSDPGTCNDTFGTRAPATGGTDLGSGASTVPFSQGLTGLMPDATVYFCAIAQNSAGTSFGAVLSFTPQQPNQPPVAGDDNLIATEDTPLNVTVASLLANDIDPDGDNLISSFSLVTGMTSQGGSVSLDPSSLIVTYTPPNNFTGTDTFAYIVSDGEFADTGIVTVQVNAPPIPPPTVITNAASNVTGTTATLNGSANPSGSATTGWFRWSYGNPGTCDDTFGNRAPGIGGSDLGSGTSDVPFSEGLTGLMPDATVYYCAIAQNAAGTSFGAVLSFTPQQPNQPPVAVDDNVIATEDTPLNFPASSLLANDTDPDNDLLDIVLPSPTTSQGGTVTLTVPGPLGIVTYTPPNNFTGTDTFTYIVTDGDLFDTGLVTVQVNPNIPPPTVNTAAASSVNGQSATLNGSANPNGSATTGWFRYSLSDPGTCNDTFGTRTPTVGGVDVGSGTSAVPFSQGLTGLMPDATVYYCAIAQNAGGTSFGAVQSFTPQWVPPTANTNAASSVASTSATLNGSANPSGSSATAWFRYSTSNPGTCNDVFGTRTPLAGGSDLGSGSSDSPYSQAISGLSPETTYFYCAIAQNSGGTAFGSVLQFATSQLNVGISVNQSSLNFGNQTLGTTGPVQGVTIVSTGSDPLVLGNLSLFGDAADFQFVQVPAAGTVLQPGESITADFAFAPTALGLRNAILSIESNSFHTPSVELIGAGVVPDINVTPLSIDFGTISTGLGGGVQQMQISNLGTGDLVIAGAAFTGPNAADFSSSQVTEVIIIPSGQIYPITIIFNPQGIGPRSASLDLGSNDPDEPSISIPLSGTGVSPGFLQFSAASYSGNEGDGTIALTIQRVNGSQGAVSAFFSASGGLATGGEACGGGIDYVNQIPLANFADGDTEPKTVLVTVCDDTFVENTETFAIQLFSTDAEIGANTQAVVAITDNDEAGQISISGTITKADDSGLADHSVGLTGSAIATTSTDASGLYTFADVTSGSFVVTPASDPLYLFDPISRNYPNRTTNVNDANFKAYEPGTEPRTLTIVKGFATPGQQALIPIMLQSQGNEAGLTFSMDYDEDLLSGATVECGSAAGAGCSLTVNTDTPGLIGISVDPVAATFAAGSREVVRVLFFTNVTASVPSTPLYFANTPAVTEISDGDANPLLTRYVAGTLTFIQGIESDVAVRPNGDGSVTSVDVAQVRRFAVGLDTFDSQFNEFQRADSAPYATAGDGVVAATDITQARRYQVGADPTQPAGGPSIGSSLTALAGAPAASLFAGQATRGIRVVDASAGRGSQVNVALQVDAEGDENVYGFSLDYDANILSNPVVTIGSDAAGGNVLANTAQPGRIGFSVDFGSGAMPAGAARQLVTIRFDVSQTAPFGQTPLEFADTPAFRETSNSAAQALETTYTNGFVTILAPTAADASISGRVMTSSGRPISGAVVTVLDMNGVSRTFMTGTFGYFSFEGLAAGQTYMVTVASRRYRFADPSRVVDLSDSVTGLDFIGTQ